jgi:hypothetical protein
MLLILKTNNPEGAFDRLAISQGEFPFFLGFDTQAD